MSKQKLKLWFSDFWPGFIPNDNLFVHLLSDHFDIELSKDPDLLIYSVYDFNHIKFKCAKIFYTAENVRPNYNECDFSLSFDYNSYGGKNLRLPLYRWRGDLEQLCVPKVAQQVIKDKKKFACMVVSNNSCKERNRFFHLLNEYKKVDSGGRFMNNVGGPVHDKMDFIKDYKFVLSFENSSYPGYTTEKIVEPMLVHSLPVYWGNPCIKQDFNPSSFINVHDYKSFNKAVEAIVRIDQDDDLFMRYLQDPYFHHNKVPDDIQYYYFEERLTAIVGKILKRKPVSTRFYFIPIATANKFKKKILSRVHRRPHFYY